MKYAWINKHRDQFPITRLCQQLQVSRTGFMQWAVRAPSKRQIDNEQLDAKIFALHHSSNKSYGRPRIVDALGRANVWVGHERVRRSLVRQHLKTVHKRPYTVTTDSEHTQPIAPNLLQRRFNGWQLNQAWVGDITFIDTQEGWLYLAVIIDLASRKVVGWSMSERIKAELVTDALKFAYWRLKPEAGLIMHTDRGSQYASKNHVDLLTNYGMRQSMSRRADCWDNAVAESFFKTLKVERVYQTQYATRQEARLDIVNWIEGFYNAKRLHTAIGGKIPNQLEQALKAA